MRHEPGSRATAGGSLRQAWYRLAGACAVLLALSGAAVAQLLPFTPNDVTTSTVPANGDVNPYGVAFVPPNFPAGGTLQPGDILVANFNNSKNLQGTGTTIIKYTPNSSPVFGKAIAPPGQATVFFRSPTPDVTGLDTGLNILQRGFVLNCFLPSTNGMFATHTPGGILVLNSSGAILSTIAGKTNHIDGPWDMTVFDQGATAIAFVSNVGNANNHGFVTRLVLAVSKSGVSVTSATIIASGYEAAPNAMGFVTGPTGLVYDPATDILYIASTKDNAVFAVQHAGTRHSTGGPGIMVFADADVLRGPLGMAQAPNGDLIAANSDLINSGLKHPSEYVEFTKNGAKTVTFVSEFNIDVNQGGAFGIAAGTVAGSNAPILAVVDDNVPNLNIFTGLPPSINGADQQ